MTKSEILAEREKLAEKMQHDEQELLEISVYEDHGHQAAADFRIGFRYGHPRGFKKGFDAAVALMLKREDKLRESLKIVTYCDRTRGYPTGSEWTEVVNVAKQALSAVPYWDAE